MRAHNLLNWIGGDHGSLHADAWELFLSFRGHEILPYSFDADAEAADANTWALFCFCLWTLSKHRRPHNVSNELGRDGVSAWTNVANEESNAVQWVHECFTNWERCMNVKSIEIDLDWQVMAVTYKDDSMQFFRNRHTANPWVIGQARKTQPDQITVIGSDVLWHVAGFFVDT